MSKPRRTRSPIYVRLSEKRIKQIESLIEGWSFETRLFVLRRLRQYNPKRSAFDFITGWLRGLFKPVDRSFQFLRNPEALSDWRRRIEVSGSRSASATWNKILAKELDWNDYHYLTYLLERRTADIFVPPRFREIFERIYHAHILKEYTEDPSVPRAPLVVVIGSSGSGKSATVKQALEEAIFSSEVRRTRSSPPSRSGAASPTSTPSSPCASSAGARPSACVFSPASPSSNTSSASGSPRPSPCWRRRGSGSITPW
jgi:hypothetical protein